MSACSSCGAKNGKHLPGCDVVGGSGGHRRGGPGSPGGNSPSHKHKYIWVSTEEFDAVDRGKTYHYVIKHFECAGEGKCNQPKYDDIKRSRK